MKYGRKNNCSKKYPAGPELQRAKTQTGKARCLHANYFIKDPLELNFYEKLKGFEKNISLNHRAKTNTVHISLNFSPGEKFNQEKLVAIASAYMDKIGFSDQPYLVYEHLDAGHPHLHIVATNITAEGKRLSLHNLGKNASSKAREEIEKDFSLINATNQPKASDLISSIQAQKIHYGKVPTKRAISSALQSVLTNYKFASLAELNALLKLYNLQADRGEENSRIYKNNGLIYRVLDDQGNKIGVPVKASSLPHQPTLKNLTLLFLRNKTLKENLKKNLRVKLDWALHGKPADLKKFAESLNKENVLLIPRKNENNIIYGLTYIDLQNKVVFNGSEIGKGYSAKGISEQLNGTIPFQKQAATLKISYEYPPLPFHTQFPATKSLLDIIQDLQQPVDDFEPMSFELTKRKKKKKTS